MPQTVWCDNKECIYHDDEYGVGECDVYRLDIKGGVCVGSSRNGRNVTSNDVVERLRAENEKLRELAYKAWKAAERLCLAFEGPCSGDCNFHGPCPMGERDGECVYGQLQRELRELGVEVD